MQQKLLKLVVLQLRIAGALLILAIITALLLSFRVERTYGDIWQQLGLTREKGLTNIKASFLNGYFHYYGAEKAKNLVSGDRSAIAKDLLGYTKELVSSAAFKKEYETMRNGGKPEKPVLKIRSKDEIRKEKIAETEASIQKTEKTLKEVNADMAKAIRPVLDVLKDNLKEYQKPDSKIIGYLYDGEKMNAANEQKSYEERLTAWEKEYPADYRIMIRTRLEHFVELAKTVDFDAQLKQSGNKKKFIDPRYEGKPYDWKMIYRAGREVIVPAISFAEAWIKELNTLNSTAGL